MLLDATAPTGKRRFPIAQYNKLAKCPRKELLNSKNENEASLKTVTMKCTNYNNGYINEHIKYIFVMYMKYLPSIFTKT